MADPWGTGQEFYYIQDILKEFYAPAIVNQVYKKAPFWAQIQKRDKGVYGKRVVIPVQTAFTEAVGSRSANDYSLPTSQRNTYDQAYIYMKRIYGRVQVDGFSIESAKNKGGWIDVVTGETKGVSNAFAIEVDRQSMGRGTSILGLVDSVSTVYITPKDPHGITGDTPIAKWFRTGMVCDIVDASTGVDEVAGFKITSINSTTGVLTTDATVTAAEQGDYIVRKDSYSATAADVGDMMGIDGIIDSANTPGSDFEGINRSTTDVWQAHEDSTSQVLSENVIQVELDSIEKRTDGESVNLALTTYDLRNKLIELIRADRMVDTMDLKAGWQAIKYVGGQVSLPIMVHKNCPVGYKNIWPTKIFADQRENLKAIRLMAILKKLRKYYV
jgi:hypothetical protein